MIAVAVGIDEVFDRLIRYLFYLIDDLSGALRATGSIYNDHAPIVNDDRAIPLHDIAQRFGPVGYINSFPDLFKLEIKWTFELFLG